MKKTILWLLATIVLMPVDARAYKVITTPPPEVFPTGPHYPTANSLSPVRVIVSGKVELTTESEEKNGGCFDVRIIEADRTDDDFLEYCTVRFPKGTKPHDTVTYWGVAPLLECGIGLLGPYIEGTGNPNGYSWANTSGKVSGWDIAYELGYAGWNSGNVFVILSTDPMAWDCDDFRQSVRPTTCSDSGAAGKISEDCARGDTLFYAVPALSWSGTVLLIGLIALAGSVVLLIVWRS